MSLEFNLGDELYDNFFKNNVIVVARLDENGQRVILPGYEDSLEVLRVLVGYVEEPEGRVVVVTKSFNGGNKAGDAYYSYVGDDEMETVK